MIFTYFIVQRLNSYFGKGKTIKKVGLQSKLSVKIWIYIRSRPIQVGRMKENNQKWEILKRKS